MRLLSFDTSSRGLSVAIMEDGRILAEANFDGQSGEKSKADRQEAVSLLLPTIDELTVKIGFKKSDFSAIVVGIGPGGFTGVRVAVVTARTLGQALNLPVVGINSLEVAAYGVLSTIAQGAAPAACGIIKEASKTHFFFASYKIGASLPGATAPSENFFDIEPVIAPSYLPGDLFMTSEAFALDRLISWYAEPQLAARLASFFEPGEPGGAEITGPAVQMLTPVNNVASCQAKIAHVRLSLSQLSLNAVEGGALLVQYPYRLVQPLYLRGASVTLKKGDVIERVETH